MKRSYWIASVIVLLALGVLATANAFLAGDDEGPGDKEVIVLLHGLGRNANSMWLLASRLEDAGYYVLRVDYSSLHQTPDEILKDINSQIDRCCRDHSLPVHFVGHSLGGLMVRAYLQPDTVETLGRVVLLGTPNKGAEAADHFSNSWLINILGPTARALGTGDDSFPNSLEPPTYPVGVIAGLRDSRINDRVIPGQDDGVVSVEATKIDAMTDFIIIETGHSMMRYDREVAEQTLHFIKNGAFKAPQRDKPGSGDPLAAKARE